MPHYLLALLLLLPAALVLGQGKKPPKSAPAASLWVQKAPSIDGDLTDWGYVFENNPKNELQCFVGNDSAYVYLGVRIQSPQIQLLAMQLGITFWVDTLGKQRNHRGLAFPLGVSDADWEAWSVKGRGDRILIENLYCESRQDFDLLGYADEPLRASNLTSRDVKVAARFDLVRNLCYEMRIPIALLVEQGITPEGPVLGCRLKINDIKNTVDTDDVSNFNNPNANAITQPNPLMGGMPGGGMGGMNNPNFASGRRMGPSSMQSATPNVSWRVRLVRP